jgi:hypothetical protein
MTRDQIETLVSYILFILFNLLLIGFYDVYRWKFVGIEATITYSVRALGKMWPPFPFISLMTFLAVTVLIWWHFFGKE